MCNFCTNPGEFVVTGEKMTIGLPFYEVVCAICVETFKEEKWPVNKKMNGEIRESEQSDTDTNNTTSQEDVMKASKATTAGIKKTVTKSDKKSAKPKGPTFSELIVQKMGKGTHSISDIIAIMVKTFPEKTEKTVSANTRWYINKMKGDKTLIQNQEGLYKVKAGK